jgi:hypothetical protein
MMMEMMIMFIILITVLIILWRVQPLLCGGGYTYTIPVSGQRLSKRLPIARQKILNNATVGL